MYFITTEGSFDSAHFLSNYEGKCSNIHGHRWKVVVEIGTDELVESGQTRGMIVDFGDLKKCLNSILDEFDHCLIYEMGTLKDKTIEALTEENFRLVPVSFRPTAECFSEYFYGRMENAGYAVRRVTVYETPNNCAAYSR